MSSGEGLIAPTGANGPTGGVGATGAGNVAPRAIDHLKLEKSALAAATSSEPARTRAWWFAVGALMTLALVVALGAVRRRRAAAVRDR